MYRIKRWHVAVACVAVLVGASTTPGVIITFDTEDDFTTPLMNGQIVDPAFDPVDLEFGNLFDVSSTSPGTGPHLGVTVFDSDQCCPSEDDDLLVNRGNILILQDDEEPGTMLHPNVGLRYQRPDDEDEFSHRGSIVFDFFNPVVANSIDLVDVNGDTFVVVTLTDSAGKQRQYDVPNGFTNNFPTLNGFDTLNLNTLANQVGEGGGTVTASQDIGFDSLDVRKLDVFFIGSGGLDTLRFEVIPEPTTLMLLAIGAGLLVRRRRKGQRDVG